MLLVLHVASYWIPRLDVDRYYQMYLCIGSIVLGASPRSFTLDAYYFADNCAMENRRSGVSIFFKMDKVKSLRKNNGAEDFEVTCYLITSCSKERQLQVKTQEGNKNSLAETSEQEHHCPTAARAQLYIFAQISKQIN